VALLGLHGRGFVVSLAEHLVEAYLDKADLEMALSELWASKDFDHLLAANLCVALSFLLYNTFTEMDRRLGRGSIRRLLLSTQVAEGNGAPVDHAKM
jgi:hypothetical protein